MTNCSGYEDLNTNCGYCGCSADEHTNGQCVATDMYIKKKPVCSI